MTTDPDPKSKLDPLADLSPEERRRAFMDLLWQVEEETDRKGAVTLDEALAEVDRIIAEAEQRRRG